LASMSNHNISRIWTWVVQRTTSIMPTNELGWLRFYSKNLYGKMDGKKVLLIVDNCLGHLKTSEGLKNIDLFFLPPNTTSKILLCDVGIIQAFKMHYCRWFYENILKGYEIKIPNPEKINILDAMNLTFLTWRTNAQVRTIANYFWHYKVRSMDNMALKNLNLHLDDKVINNYML